MERISVDLFINGLLSLVIVNPAASKGDQLTKAECLPSPHTFFPIFFTTTKCIHQEVS